MNQTRRKIWFVPRPQRMLRWPLLILVLLGLMGFGWTAGSRPALAAETLLTESFDAVPDGQLPAGFRAVEGTWEVQGGRLIGKSPNNAVQGRIVFGDPTWDNYEIEVTVTFLSAVDPTRWTAVMYRVQNNGGLPYYLFTLRKNTAAANGLEQASRTPAGQWAVYLTRSWKAAFGLNEPHRLRVVVYGSSVRYYIDGELVIESAGLVKDPRGSLGLHVNGSTVAFDDIVVRRLTREDVGDLPVNEPGLIPARPETALLRPPLVIAHRGASGVAPENTLAAFRAAAEIGVDLIELDVHRTADGQLAVIHDGTVNRTAKGAYTGNVASLTMEQIRTLDAGAWKGTQYAGERVPTLEEVFETFRGRAIFLVETKVSGIETQVAAAIRKSGMANNVVLQSFDKESIRKFRDLIPEVPAGVLFGDPGIADPATRGAMLAGQVLDVKASFVAVAYPAVTQEFVKYVKSRGLSVFAWTVDDPSTMRRMIEAGVDGIITNYPERLKAMLQTYQAP